MCQRWYCGNFRQNSVLNVAYTSTAREKFNCSTNPHNSSKPAVLVCVLVLSFSQSGPVSSESSLCLVCPHCLDTVSTGYRYNRDNTPAGDIAMNFHKRILEWQAAHPNITWIGWGIIWALVLVVLFWPRTVE